MDERSQFSERAREIPWQNVKKVSLLLTYWEYRPTGLRCAGTLTLNLPAHLEGEYAYAGSHLEGEHAYAGSHLEGEHSYAGSHLEGEHAYAGSQRSKPTNTLSMNTIVHRKKSVLTASKLLAVFLCGICGPFLFVTYNARNVKF